MHSVSDCFIHACFLCYHTIATIKKRKAEATVQSLLPAFQNTMVINKDDDHQQDHDNRICP